MAEPTANGCAYIEGDDGYDVEVAGVSSHQDTVEFIVRGRGEKPADHKCQALLVPDPNDPDDPERVNVIILGRQVGHLPADVAEQMHEAMQTWSFGFATCDALIEGGWYRNNEDKGDFQVWLDLNPDFTPAAAPPTGQPAVAPAAAAVAAATVPASGFTRRNVRVAASAAGAVLVVGVLFGVGWLLVPFAGTSTNSNTVTTIASTAVPPTAATSAAVPARAVSSTTMTSAAVTSAAVTSATMTSAAVSSTAVTSAAVASTTAVATLPSPVPTSAPSEVRDPPAAAQTLVGDKKAATPIEPHGKAHVGIAAAPSKLAPPPALAASPAAAQKLLHPVAIMAAAPIPAPAVRAVAPPSTMRAVAEYEPAAAATSEAKRGSEHAHPTKRTHPAETSRSHRRAERERASRARTRASRWAHPSRPHHHYVPAAERDAPPMAPPDNPRMIAPRFGETAAERVIRDSLNDWTRHGLPSVFNPPPLPGN